MNKKQMKQIFMVVLTSILVVLISFTYVFADGSLDSNNSSSTVTPNKNQGTSSSKINVDNADRTGTRYVIRVKQEDGTFADIGGEYSRYFYLNHVYEGNVHNYDITESNESTLKEMMMAGASGISNGTLWREIEKPSGMKGYMKLKSASSIFATHASSARKYQTVDDAGNPQYRHVIKWSGTAYTDNFGLSGYYEDGVNNKGDIDVLLGFIEQVADILSYASDARKMEAENVKNQVAQIRNGDLDIEVRAEILVKVRYKFSATSYNQYKDVYAKAYNSDAAYFYTYKDSMALGGVNAALLKRVQLLYEKHQEKIEEYQKDYLYTVAQKEKYTYYTNVTEKTGNVVKALLGFDYLYDAGNPYVTNIIEEARDIDTGELITSFAKNGKREKRVKGTGTIKPPLKAPTPGEEGIPGEYIYQGLQLDGSPEKTSINPSKTTVEVNLDKASHTVTYWYKKQPNATVVVEKFKLKSTNEDLKSPITTTPINENGQNFPSESALKEQDELREQYEYIGMKVDTEEYGPEKISTTISNDFESHEIIYWYERKSKVEVEYRIVNTEELIASGEPIYLDRGDSYTFKQSNVGTEGNNYEYAEIIKVNNNKYDENSSEGKAGIYSVSGDGNDYKIIFYYRQKLKVKVFLVSMYENNDAPDNKIFFQKNDKKYVFLQSKGYGTEEYYIPGTTNEEINPPEWNGYTIFEMYTKKNGTYTGNIETPKSTGTKVTIDLGNKLSGKEATVCVYFYYIANNTLTISHRDKNDKRINNIDDDKVALTENTTVNSKNFMNDGYFNYSSKLDDEDEELTNKGTTEIYSVRVEPNGTDRTLIFYYTKQQLEVRHEYVDGTLIKNPEYVDIPTTQSKLPNYPYVGNKLNNVPGTEPIVSVDINPDIPGNQELVFLYTAPALIFGEDDPNPDPHYPDSDNYENIREELGVGVIPEDLNNQYVAQDDNKYYWVLDEKGGLTYRFAMLHINSASVSVEAKASIPFDVYIGGVLKKKGTEIGMTYKKVGSKNGYDIYEGKIENIYVPIWVDEAEHEITVSVRATTVLNGVTSQSNWGIEHAKVTVVGRIYDFSVTNILCDANRTKDRWYQSLFTINRPTNGEYEADKLPIGQKNQQDPTYFYGIKQGSKIFFSVNTKGSANTGIKILPKFYYIDKAGNWIGEVKAYSKNQEITAIDLVRSSAANDSYRVTQEYKNELVTARSVYSGVKYDKSGIGSYAKILLGAENRTPYLGYWTNTATQDSESLIAKFGSALTMDQISSNTGISKIELYKEANHWYGDYMLPSDTKYYKDGTQLAQDGFVVVYFSIVSTRGNDDYLAYNKSSGKETKTQWQVEQNGNNSYNIPKTLTNQTGKTITSWLQPANPAYMGAAPVMIYQISQSTSQNYDTVGTH